MRVHRLSVPSDHPAFAGHFPGRPILPGALLLDEVLTVLAQQHGIDLTSFELTGAKFTAPVGPGTELTLEHEATGEHVRFSVRSSTGPVLSGALARRERT